MAGVASRNKENKKIIPHKTSSGFFGLFSELNKPNDFGLEKISHRHHAWRCERGFAYGVGDKTAIRWDDLGMSDSPACARNLALDRRLDVFRGFRHEKRNQRAPRTQSYKSRGFGGGKNEAGGWRKEDGLAGKSFLSRCVQVRSFCPPVAGLGVCPENFVAWVQGEDKGKGGEQIARTVTSR